MVGEMSALARRVAREPEAYITPEHNGPCETYKALTQLCDELELRVPPREAPAPQQEYAPLDLYIEQPEGIDAVRHVLQRMRSSIDGTMKRMAKNEQHSGYVPACAARNIRDILGLMTRIEKYYSLPEA